MDTWLLIKRHCNESWPSKIRVCSFSAMTARSRAISMPQALVWPYSASGACPRIAGKHLTGDPGDARGNAGHDAKVAGRGWHASVTSNCVSDRDTSLRRGTMLPTSSGCLCATNGNWQVRECRVGVGLPCRRIAESHRFSCAHIHHPRQTAASFGQPARGSAAYRPSRLAT
jgi:hypothetical protein